MKSESQVLVQSGSKDISEYTKVVESNIEEINKMSRLVDDLLTIARTGVVQKDIVTEKVDTYNLLQKLVSKMEIQSQKKHTPLTLTGSMLSINCDAHAIERALQNIVQNAINYTPNGGSVSISLTQEKNFCMKQHVFIESGGYAERVVVGGLQRWAVFDQVNTQQQTACIALGRVCDTL